MISTPNQLLRRAAVGPTDFRALAEPYRGVTCLVLGASGFIGRWVWELLEQSGAVVFPVGRVGTALEQIAEHRRLTARPVIEDLGAPGSASRLIETLAPQVTFNAAGYGIDRAERDPTLHQRINAELPAEAAAAAARVAAGKWAGLRLVHLGSAFEYGTVSGRVTESTEPAASGVYAETKLAGTRAVAEYRDRHGVSAATARVCTIYGPGEHPQRLLPTLMRAARTGEVIDLTAGEQERDFTHVRDVAEGMLRLGLAEDAPAVVNLATGVLTSVRKFAEQAMAITGVRTEQVRFGALPYRPDEVLQGPVDTALLERTLSWRPDTAVSDGIRSTVQYEFNGDDGR